MSSLGGSINQKAMESVRRVKEQNDNDNDNNNNNVIPSVAPERGGAGGISGAYESGSAGGIPEPSRVTNDDELSVEGGSARGLAMAASAPLLKGAGVGAGQGLGQGAAMPGMARTTSTPGMKGGVAHGGSSGGVLRARMNATAGGGGGIPGGGAKGKTSRDKLVIARMSKEVEMLMEQLDEAHREREMQRHEIARVRHQLVTLAGIQPPSRGKIVGILEQTCLVPPGGASTGAKRGGAVVPTAGGLDGGGHTQSHASLAALSVDASEAGSARRERHSAHD
jgi:hypothetical protein